jgi:hypothetical protein
VKCDDCYLGGMFVSFALNRLRHMRKAEQSLQLRKADPKPAFLEPNTIDHRPTARASEPQQSSTKQQHPPRAHYRLTARSLHRAPLQDNEPPASGPRDSDSRQFHATCAPPQPKTPPHNVKTHNTSLDRHRRSTRHHHRLRRRRLDLGQHEKEDGQGRCRDGGPECAEAKADQVEPARGIRVAWRQEVPEVDGCTSGCSKSQLISPITQATSVSYGETSSNFG